MNEAKLYLIHIAECIRRIESYVEGKDAFFNDTKTQDAVLRNLQILSESTQRLSTELKDSHPEVDWRSIAGFRNILVHSYLGIRIDRVWEIIERDLPELKNSISAMLSESDGIP